MAAIRGLRHWVLLGPDSEELELELFELMPVEETNTVMGTGSTAIGASVADVDLTSPMGAGGFRRLPHCPSLKAFHRSCFSICTGMTACSVLVGSWGVLFSFDLELRGFDWDIVEVWSDSAFHRAPPQLELDLALFWGLLVFVTPLSAC